MFARQQLVTIVSAFSVAAVVVAVGLAMCDGTQHGTTLQRATEVGATPAIAARYHQRSRVPNYYRRSRGRVVRS